MGIRTNSTEPGDIDAHLVLGDTTPSQSLLTETTYSRLKMFFALSF